MPMPMPVMTVGVTVSAGPTGRARRGGFAVVLSVVVIVMIVMVVIAAAMTGAVRRALHGARLVANRRNCKSAARLAGADK